MRIRRHPPFRELSRLADREVGGQDSEALRAHLQGCSGCRGKLLYIRELGETARDISHPSPPDDALSRILERRAAGDRVILPIRARMPAPRRRAAIGLAAGFTGALLAAALLLLPADEASAGASDVIFDPPRPDAGAEIAVRYLPASYLAGEEVLYLRGAFRGPSDPPPREGLPGAFRVELLRNDDGVYAGAIQMPDDAVYGYFAVENEDASEVDSNIGRSWEVLAHRGGLPRFEALKQRLEVWPSRIESGLETADMIATYYPASIEGAYRKFEFERMLAGGAREDDLVAENRRILAARTAEVSSWRDLEDHELATFYAYASDVGDAQLTERWQKRLRTAVPDHPFATQLQLTEDLDAQPESAKFVVYERAWLRASFSSDRLYSDHIISRAFRDAMRSGSAELVERWGRRYRRARSYEADMVAESLAVFPSLRAEAKAGLRDGLAALQSPSDQRRALWQTVADVRARDAKRTRELLGTLGQILYEEGRYEAAIDTLEMALAAGWEPDAVRTLAMTYEAIGYVAEALDLYALIGADERDPTAVQDLQRTVQRRFGTTDDEWHRLVEGAELRIADRRLSDASPPRSAAGDPHVWDSEGTRVPLDSLVTDGISILVFWAGLPPRELGSSELQQSRWRILAITPSQRSEELSLSLQTDFADLEVFYDPSWEAARSLKVLGVPYHFVVDQTGRYYFAEDLAQAMRLAESLDKTAGSTT